MEVWRHAPPIKVFRFSLSKMKFPAILSDLDNLTDFRKMVETGLDLRLCYSLML